MKRLDLKKLKTLDEKATALRARLGISQPKEILFQSSIDVSSSKEVVVEADGIGGAKLLVVDGNYPIDYSILKEWTFDCEENACVEADRLAR